jgi:hypothetical protein
MALPFTVPPDLPVLSRSAWRDVLFRHIDVTESEVHWRRRCRRYAVRFGTWRLLFHNEQGIPVTARVRLLNASADGAMLMSREVIPECIPVLLVYRDEEEDCALMGEVMHCTSTVGGHKVGVELRFETTPNMG